MNYFIIHNKQSNFGNSEKGVSLYFAVIITSLLLAIVFGLTAILVSQIKIFKEMGDSVKALFAADSGMEKILYLDSQCRQVNCTSSWPGICNNTCDGFANGYYSTSSQLDDARFTASGSSTNGTTIFQSKGAYRKVNRAIEASR